MRFKKIFAIVLCMSLALAGCAKLPERTVSVEPEEVASYSAEQVYLVLAGRRQEISDVYTDKLFSIPVNDGGQTYSDTYNSMIKEYLENLQIMAEIGAQRGTVPGEEELSELEAAADGYMKEFEDSGNTFDITREAVMEILEKEKIAELLREEIINSADIEVSESDARVVDVIRIEHNDSEAAYATLEEINSDPDANVQSIARRNSQNSEIEIKVARGDLPQIIEDEIFALEDDEVSSIVTCDGKYYIFKCITGYDMEATAENKEHIISERKKRAVTLEYEAYSTEHPYSLDTEIWKQALKMYTENPEIPDIYKIIN